MVLLTNDAAGIIAGGDIKKQTKEQNKMSEQKVDFEVLRSVGIDGKGYKKGDKVTLDAGSLDARYMLGMGQIKPATEKAEKVVKEIEKKSKA